MKFYNRDTEREKIKSMFDLFENNESIAIWIEGRRGIGKTYLLNYMAHNYEQYLFKYSNNSILYRCNKGKHESNFDYITSILAILQEQNSSKFNQIVVNYFDSISSQTIKEGLMEVLPQIAGIEKLKGVFEKFKNNIESSQNAIHNIMIDNHLIKCFSELLIELLKGERYIFCIDDIAWLDEKSREVLISVMNSKKNIMSFFITTRHYDDLEEEWEKQQYNIIHDEMFECIFCNNFYEVRMSDFKKEIVYEILKDYQRNYLLDNFDIFFKITNGNPLEIRNSLKYSDTDIQEKIKMYKKENSITEKNNIYNFVSIEFVSDCMDSNLYNQSILAILAIIDMEIPITLLIKICKEIFEQIHHICFENYNFEKSITELMNESEIQKNSGYQINIDSHTDIIINNLINNDTYYEYVKIIANILYENGCENQLYYCILLKICTVTSSVLGFEYFKQMCLKDISFNANLIHYASLNFRQCFNNVSSENINNIVIDYILYNLLNYGKLEEANKLCQFLYININLMSKTSLYKYYSAFVKVLVDLGEFNNNTKYNANTIYQELCQLEIQDYSHELERNLIGMTVYEHQNNFKKIYECYEAALQIVKIEPQNIDNVILSKFYRNKGLVQFHANLIDEYTRALDYAQKIENNTDKKIMYGTAMNNLGLAYFYSEKIDDAIKCFEISQNTLFDIGYEIVRPLNNLACCYFINQNITSAYDCINKALEYPFCGLFEQSCARLNQALILTELKDFESAQKILDNFIEEFEKNPKQDNWVYSNAYLLRGYLYYIKNDFIFAYKDYKKSTYYSSRFENDREQLRRTVMSEYCLSLESITNKFDIDQKIDLNGVTHSFYKKPYILCLLAYYVI